jgi:uroporphyrinogen decarboxylase
MPWPDPLDPARYRGLREYAKRVRETTEYALFGMAPCGHDLLNQLFRVRGMENGLIDLIQNIDFAEAFLDRMTETITKAQKAFLDEVGDLIDIHFAADDLAGQNGPLISPKTFRELIKTRWARIIAAIKSKTKAKILFHSDGAIEEFIPDLIEIGIDIINPVQVSAKGMEPAKLKKKYGKNISFWGGGCDTQRVLPYGTPAQVQEEVKRRIKELAPGGGFVFSAVHNIQPFVPIENILEMFRSAKQFGVYPIRLD